MKLRFEFLAACIAFAVAVQADFEGREIVRRPDVCDVDIIDTVSWFSEESVRLTVEPWRCGVPVEIPTNTTAAWVVCDEGGTNWIVRYDPAPATNSTTFFLAAGEGNLPNGHDYVGYVSLLDGTNILGVLDRHDVRVLGQAVDGGEPISPEGGAWGSVLQRLAALESAITNLPPAGVDFPIVTNAAFTNFAFPRGITMEGEDIPDITAGGLPSFNFSGLVRYRYANSPWLSLVGYPCVGLFGLHGSFQVNQSGPYVVGGLGFAGSSSRLEITDGELTFGGEPIGGGVPAIEAGRGISIATTTDETAVVSAALAAGHGITISTNAQDTALAIAVPRNIDFDDVTIRGNLSVYGTEYKTTTIYNTTNINVGVRTNYYTEDVYTTNRVYQHVYVVERTTNYVDEVINVGGNVDHSRATWVREPSFTVDNTDTNAPVLAATGEWDFTAATLDLGTNAVSSLNGWTGPITLTPGSNILFQTDAITKTLTILSTNGGTIANAWTTLYDSTGTPKTPTGETPLKLVTSTNHTGVVWGTAETIGTNTVEVLSIGLQVAGGGGDSGVWTPTNRIVTATSDYVLPTDYLIWMAGDTNQTLTLPNMAADSQTIIVRQLGDTTTTIIRGTNTWTLNYNGDGLTIDWISAFSNWFWRTF